MPPRAATVPAFAKLNLSLLVLGKRTDGYHELRTVFQSITLADRLAIEFHPGPRAREIDLASNVVIPGENLVTRAARALMESTGIRGRVRIRLHKRIPMGAGLGGGSSNAAAVLLALPALARKPVPLEELHRLAAALGSDVPFFLHGGTALGLGRGEDLYPLPEPRRPRHVLLAAPGIHVSTPEAFAALARPPVTGLTPAALANRMKRFQSLARGLACATAPDAGWEAFCENDFEPAVYPRHPSLKSLHRKLGRSGAGMVRMTGSGSALFGLFDSPAACRQGKAWLAARYPRQEAMFFTARFSTRAQYRAAFRRALGLYATEAAAWPPR